MITISLDEQGVFEKNNDSTGEIVMIAGVVFDDLGDKTEVSREKTRIRNYFEQVCAHCHGNYPRDLHVSDGSKSQNDKVKNVKKEYTATLGEFLQKGTYRNKPVQSDDKKPRTGKYYTYAMIRGRKTKSELSGDDVSNLIDENLASNLYMHMVEDTISRLLFYNNTFIDHDSVSFDLATRVYKGDEKENLSNHTDKGYNTRITGRGDRLVYLTNSDVFRTALERDMLTEDENDIDIASLVARPINYDSPDAGHELLYLADAVCTVLGFENVYGINKEYLKKARERMNRLSDENFLLFTYDEADTVFSKAWRNCEAGDLYTAFSYMFDVMNQETEAAVLYRECWEKELYKRVCKKADSISLQAAIDKLFRSTRKTNIDQDKLIYIFERLEEIVAGFSFTSTRDKSILYDLYDAGIAAYNHVGDYEKAGKCGEKCEKYARYIGIEREIRNRNRRAVSLCDAFRYDEAAKIAEANYEYYNIAIEVQKRLFNKDVTFNHSEFGVVCSQLGQIYAYMCNPKAEAVFKQALSLIERNTADYFITETHLLHYYLSVNDKAGYEEYATEYFGGFSNLEEQLTYIATEGTKERDALISMKYALFVYLKAIALFYTETLSEELRKKLSDIEETVKEITPLSAYQLTGHPWELSYKYLAIIAFKTGQTAITAKYAKKLEKCLEKKGDSGEVTVRFAKLELAGYRSPGRDKEKETDELCELIRKINPDLIFDNTLEAIESFVTYENR